MTYRKITRKLLTNGIFQSTIMLSTYRSIHVGLFIGLPALTLLTIGKALVIYDEPK